MLVAYFDEVKNQKSRPFYWLGALVADATLIWKLEQELNALSEEVFGTREMSRNTEFHASSIMNGNESCKGWPVERRLEVMKRLISVLGAAEGLGRIFIKINVEKVKFGIDIEATAFQYLVERIDSYLQTRKSPGILIGDRESETAAGKFAKKLSEYRNTGTDWFYGKKIEYLIDTVHFTHSHHSRMLQMADLHIYLRQMRAAGAYGNSTRQQVLDHVSSIPDCLFPNKYKEWPQS